MRKFVIQIIGILSISLILLLVFDFTYTTIYENANPRTKFQYLRSLKNTKVNYVFLGSSRVENGIDPFIVENRTQKKCINLGYEAAKLGDNEYTSTYYQKAAIHYELTTIASYSITSLLLPGIICR